MSPYQSQVIDASLAEFDRQAAMRQQGISDQAVAMGGYGGGREGVCNQNTKHNQIEIELYFKHRCYNKDYGHRAASKTTRFNEIN